MGVCNLEERIGGALEESVFLPQKCLAPSKICFFVLFTKKTSKGLLTALSSMTLHLLEFLQCSHLAQVTVFVFSFLYRGVEVFGIMHMARKPLYCAFNRKVDNDLEGCISQRSLSSIKHAP